MKASAIVALLEPGVANDQEVFEAQHEEIEQAADQGDQNHRQEHGGGVERDLHLQHQVAETAVGAEEFADDRAGDGEDRRDLHSGEDVGQGAGQLDLGEYLPARALERAHQVEQIGFDLAQAARRGQDDREETDREGHQDVGSDAVLEPDDDQRTERDLRDHVEADEQGHHGHLESAEPGEQERDGNADDDGKAIAAEDLHRRDRDVLEPAIVGNQQRMQRVVGRRHDELRDVPDDHEVVPRNDQREVAQ